MTTRGRVNGCATTNLNAKRPAYAPTSTAASAVLAAPSTGPGPQTFIRLGLAVGQPLTTHGDPANIDLVITAAAAHMAQAAQLISDASEKIAPLLDRSDADDDRRRRRPMVESIRRWVSKAA